jgi:hypothetical protein
MAEEAAGAVRPTLFIGLGGTGKEILLRVRRSFYEKWKIPGLPITGYLWFDTDPRDVTVAGEQLDELDQLLKFQQHEKLSLLAGAVKEGLGTILHERDRYPYIHSWLPEQVETYGSEIENGAGAVRSIGRLTFFDKIKEIEHLVRVTAAGITENPARIETSKKYLPNAEITDLQAFLVFSIAGGTGGGTFLDMAFLLKHIFPGIHITGVAVLPNAYFLDAHEEDAARCYGNAYSALKELEHFSRRIRTVKVMGDDTKVGIEYEVDWTGHNPKRIQGPPFGLLYLSELINEANVSAGKRSEQFRAIAQTIFLDFLPGRFSTQKRSKAANLAQSLSGIEDDQVPVAGTTLTQSFSRRYAAFGLSKIEIPVESIREACACRLAAGIIESVNRPSRDPNLMGALARETRGRFDIDGLETLLGPDWKQVLETDLRTVCPERWSADSVASSEALKTFVAGLGKKLDDFEHQHLDSQGHDPKGWGSVVSLVRNSTKPASIKLKAQLREFVAEMLDKPELGLNALLGEAGLLALQMQNFRKIYKAPAPTVSEKRQQDATKEAAAYKALRDKALNAMTETLGNRMIWVLGARKWTLTELYKQARDAADQQSKAKASVFRAEEAAKLAKIGEEYLAELKALLEDFAARLPPAQGHFAELERSLLDFSQTYSSIRLYTPEDLDNFYLLNFDEDTQRHHLVDVKREYESFLRETLGAKKQTLDLVDAFQREGNEWLRTKLRTYTSTRFKEDFDSCRQERERHRNCGRFVEALNHVAMKQDSKGKYDQFVNGALPMLRRSKKFPGAKGTEIKSVYLGVPSRTGEPYVSFIDSVRQRLRAYGYDLNDNGIIDNDDPTSVYLYVEVHAFPLPTLPIVVDTAHEAYYDFYRRTGKEKKLRTSAIPLHASNAWEGEFEDLRPMSQDLARPSFQALEILSVGPLLGVVGIQAGTTRRTFVYKDWRGAYSEDVVLGNKREAIERLTHDAALRGTLLRHLERREAGWQGDPASVSIDAQLPHLMTSGPQPSATDFFWALLYLNVKLFPESTPEYSIVQRRLMQLHRTVGNGIDLNDLSAEAREKKCRESLNGKVTWVGDIPVLKGFAPVQVGQEVAGI